MKKLFLISLFFLLSQIIFSQKLNRSDKKGERHGKWIVYNDSAKTKKSTEGKYRHGKPVGRFYFYTMEGVLERKEVNRFKILKTTFYYPDKTIRHKGKARLENLPDKIHYYFYGKWKYYNEQGELLKYVYYEKGKLIRTVYLDKTNKTNDSLIFALNEMDKHFNENNTQLLDSIALSNFNVPRRERLQLELYMTDTLTFHNLDKIFSLYGYPSKERAKESAIIPYYILSYAPLGIREKYLDMLKAAADKGDIEWKTLVFYIDKIKIAKGEKQIYGTQYYYSKKEFVDYPVEDPEGLEERRAKVGL